MDGNLSMKDCVENVEGLLIHMDKHSNLMVRHFSTSEIVAQLAAKFCTDEQLREVIHGRTVEAMADQLPPVSPATR